MPYCKFILPTAPTQPVTMNMGMSMPSWYDITGLDERSNENCKGIEDSYQRILNLLDTEHITYSLPYTRMVLIGFSQGGALSLYTGYQCPTGPLGGIVCMSGYLPAVAKFTIPSNNPLLKQTPTLHCHGTQDMVVQYRMATKTQSTLLNDFGVTNYTLKQYPIGHTVSPDELRDVTQFLLKILPNDPSYNIKLQDPTTMSVKQLKESIRKAGLTHKAIGFMEKREYIQLLQEHRSGKL
jgi:lysophospholipase II